MLLRPRSLDLLFFSECKDIVPDDVLPPVMLVESPMDRSIDDIILREETCGPFIKINPPAAIDSCGDVMKDIVPDNRSAMVAYGSGDGGSLVV